MQREESGAFGPSCYSLGQQQRKSWRTLRGIMQEHGLVVTHIQIHWGLILIEFVKRFEDRGANIFGNAFAGRQLAELGNDFALARHVEHPNGTETNFVVAMSFDHIDDW